MVEFGEAFESKQSSKSKKFENLSLFIFTKNLLGMDVLSFSFLWKSSSSDMKMIRNDSMQREMWQNGND